MRYLLAVVAGFVAGVFVASTSTQLRAALDAANAVELDPETAAARARAEAELRGMGVTVGS